MNRKIRLVDASMSIEPLVAACFLMLAVAPVAEAQNLVVNGELDLDADGWTVISP